MNKKSKYLFFSFLTLFLFLAIELGYLKIQNSVNDEILKNKLLFVKLSGLPDLAISTEATYIRHRSLSDMFSIYKDDGALREYFPSTFAISHSHIINPHVKKILDEK